MPGVAGEQVQGLQLHAILERQAAGIKEVVEHTPHREVGRARIDFLPLADRKRPDLPAQGLMGLDDVNIEPRGAKLQRRGQATYSGTYDDDMRRPHRT